jgi:hypothetical protein
VAFIAYYFHWSPEEIMLMEHADRRGWVAAISSINGSVNATADGDR